MAQGSGQAMDLDGFLGHSTRGAQATYLDGWHKDRNPPEVHVVLHTRAPIMAVWSHPWPRIVTRERDGKDQREVWSGTFNSWETEDVLTQQYKRDDTGKRLVQPQICPMSLLLEELHRLYREGDLRWDTALFRFCGDDPTKAKVLHVGSMLNVMKKLWDDLPGDEKRTAIKAGFPSPADSWKENMMAKCQYIFTLVDYDDVAAGLQVARETTLVGDKMKKAIRDRIAAEGVDAGHPAKSPYVFHWKYVANAKEFNNRYDVVALGKTKPITPAILELVKDKDPPDISRLIARGDVVELRSSMEDNYIGPAGLLDWDYIFGTAERLLGLDKEAEEGDAEEIADSIVGDEGELEVDPEPTPAAAAPKVQAKAAPAATTPAAPVATPAAEAATAGRRTRRVAKPAEDPKYVVADRRTESGLEKVFAADGMELLECEECSTLMRADEGTCRNCGAEYDVEATPQPAVQVAAPKAAPKAAASAPKAAAPTAAGKAAQPAGTAEASARAAGKERLGF